MEQQENLVIDFGCEDQAELERDGIHQVVQMEEEPEPEIQPDLEGAAEPVRQEAAEQEEQQLQEDEPVPRRQLRDRNLLRRPSRFDDSALFVDTVPVTFEDAITSGDADKWLSAMRDEMDSLHENDTWELVELPKGKRAIGSKWVFTEKLMSSGSTRYKARLVAKGFTQREGVDYFETFAPVVRYESIRLLLAVAAAQDFEIAQFDVRTAFLNGKLEEEIYLQQPTGFEDKERPTAVCRLRRSLYGLKQSPRCWNTKFVGFLEKFDFHSTKSDQCVFLGKVNGVIVYLALYVDDGLVLSSSQAAINEVLELLKQSFQITIASRKQFIGLEITRNQEKRTIKSSQGAYIRKILRKFHMEDAKSSTVPAEPGLHLSKSQCSSEEDFKTNVINVPYREAIGSLLFAAKVSRPDIEYAVNQASQFLTNFGPEHWQAVKKIMRYLKGTVDCGIVYGESGSNVKLCGFTDADYAGNIDTRKSTSGFVFLLNCGAISWSSKRQRVVALSTTEAEYIALSNGTKDAIWLRRIICELGLTCDKVRMYVDNQSAIKLTNNPEYHRKTKHIDVRFHFVRDVYERGDIDVTYIESKEQLADIFTKPLPKVQLNYLRSKIGLVDESK